MKRIGWQVSESSSFCSVLWRQKLELSAYAWPKNSAARVSMIAHKSLKICERCRLGLFSLPNKTSKKSAGYAKN